MRYAFPVINHIDDVLPAIADRDEFIVAKKDGYQVVNYAVMMEDSFPPVTGEDFCPGCKEYKTEIGDCGSQRCPDFVSAAAIRRECRGLVFDLEGNVINRRYHKFFNMNERDETRFENISFDRPHMILEKLDGSMVSPCYVKGHVRWMTKMGITDTSMEAETFVATHPKYVEFAKENLDSGWTPVFEWCSNKNRIVVSYPEDQLVLTALRHNESGYYARHELLQAYGKRYDMPVVKAYDYDSANILDIVRGMEDAEGVVIRFFDGHMLKVKADWYVLRHKSKDAITREKNVLDYIVNEKVDDVLPFLQVEDQARLLKFQDKFWEGFNESLAAYEDHYQNVVQAGVDRKQYALEWKPVIEKTFPFAPQYAFGRFAGRDGKDMLVDHVRKNIGTQSKVNEVRKVWGGHEWSYSFEGDE
jgi:RNA ligase